VTQTGVTVTEAVWAAIRKGLAGDEPEWSIEMLLRPRGDVAEAAAAVTAVLSDLQAAWGREAERTDNWELPSIGEWAVVQVAEGVRFQVIEPEAFPGTLENVVEGLERRGVSGGIGLYRPTPAEAPPPYVDLLACRMRVIGERVQREPTFYRWIANPDAHKAVVAAAERWCGRAGPDVSYALQVDTIGPFTIAPGESVTDRLMEPGRSVFTATDEHRWRGVQLPPSADVVALAVGGEALSGDQLRRAVDDLTAMLRELGRLLVYGAIRRGWDFLSDPGAADALDWPKRPRSSPRGSKFTQEAFEDIFAPDAFGVQLLGPGYADRAIAGDEWSVENLGHDRRLLSHRDRAAWFDAPFVPLGDWHTRNEDHPTPDVLGRARRQLEPILYVPGVLAAAGYTGLDEWE